MFLQAPFPLNTPLEVAEALTLLVLAALLGGWLGHLTLAGRLRTLRKAIAARQTELGESRLVPAEPQPAPVIHPAAQTVATPVLAEIAPDFDPVLPSVETLIPTLRPATEEANDDLKILEGVGPRIEELLHNAGIKTFLTLASTPTSRLQEILDGAGPRYQIHDPGTWPEQARLAAEGRWTELRVWQTELSKGKIN